MIAMLPYVLLGLAAGILGGGFGIGGGALMVPAMIIFMKVDPHVAIGTSLAIIVPISLSGAFRHFTFQNVDLSIAIPAAVGGIVGAIIGAAIIEGIPAIYAKRGLAIFLVYVSIRLWLSK